MQGQDLATGEDFEGKSKRMIPIGPMQVPQYLNQKYLINNMNQLCFREDFL